MSMTEEERQSALGKVASYLQKKGRLELWSGVLAMRGLQDFQDEQKKNQAAEGSYVRRTIWGSQEKSPTFEDHDMPGHTILGDVIQPTPYQPQSSGIGKLLAGAALGASLIGVPGAGVAGYFLNQYLNRPQTQQSQSDETVNLGLTRFEDLRVLPAQ